MNIKHVNMILIRSLCLSNRSYSSDLHILIIYEIIRSPPNTGNQSECVSELVCVSVCVCVPVKKKKKVCESGVTSHSHNAYRPITLQQQQQQPEGSQPLSGPNTTSSENLEKAKIKKTPTELRKRREAAAGVCRGGIEVRVRDGSGPGLHVKRTNAALETFWTVKMQSNVSHSPPTIAVGTG
ncbi:zinc finger protein PLAGL2 [Xyrichtys novacula]|uniref:Zinc finger protein PLAGL2 n=1 Tax=Xyrichtys novacula TaxID=13765 RepID=A0AAV1F2X0_XYRNO|nr:zinc finger protein PLAGL2 [Xyrichtys novacula]